MPAEDAAAADVTPEAIAAEDAAAEVSRRGRARRAVVAGVEADDGEAAGAAEPVAAVAEGSGSPET